MATTTLQNLRREFAQYLGYPDIVGKDGLAWTTTTDIGSSTTIISTELRDYGFDDLSVEGSGDDMFENWWIILHGSNNAQTVRRVKSYDASAGQLTVAGTSLTAESSSTDFEIHRQSPTMLRELLNTARVTSFPLLHVPIKKTVFTSLYRFVYEVPTTIVGQPTAIYLERGIPASSHGNNILSNPDFETFADSAFTSWSTSSLNIAQEDLTTTPLNYAVKSGSSSARCTSQTGNKGTLLQNISSPASYSGQTINLSIWVYCTTADVVSTSISVSGSETLGTANDSGLHTGTGWELLTASVSSAVTITGLTAGISIVSTATDNTEFYVDEAILTVGPAREPDSSREILHNWDYEPVVIGTTLVNAVRFPYALPDNYLLTFEGKSYLSSVSSESDSMEIGKPQTDLLYAHAASELYRRQGQMSPDTDGNYDSSRYAMAQADIERLSSHAVRGPKRRIKIPDWGR